MRQSQSEFTPKWQSNLMHSVSVRLIPNLLIAFVLVALGSNSSLAQVPGGLTITPTRVIFEGREKSSEITLLNSTSTKSTYRISFKNMRMLENGSYEDISEPVSGELFADEMIRFSPRQVELEPGESQTVRLQLRKPANLASGEYRSHLLFQSIPPESAGEDIEKTELKEGEIGVEISTIYAISIPVLVLQGQLSSSITMSNLAFNPPKDSIAASSLSVQLNRTGERSISGEISVTFKSNATNDEQIVGILRGIAVLFPYPTRLVQVPILVSQGTVLQNGILHVFFRARPEDGGAVISEAELQIP